MQFNVVPGEVMFGGRETIGGPAGWCIGGYHCFASGRVSPRRDSLDRHCRDSHLFGSEIAMPIGSFDCLDQAGVISSNDRGSGPWRIKFIQDLKHVGIITIAGAR